MLTCLQIISRPTRSLFIKSWGCSLILERPMASGQRKTNACDNPSDMDNQGIWMGGLDILTASVRRLFFEIWLMRGLTRPRIWIVKEDGSWHYVKYVHEWVFYISLNHNTLQFRFTARTNQGIKNHTNAEAVALAGSNPDFGTQDLFEAIESKNYPSWTVYIQALSPEAAKTFKCKQILTFLSDVLSHSGNLLQTTCLISPKVRNLSQIILESFVDGINSCLPLTDWSGEEVPYQEIGQLVLTQNPWVKQ